MPDTKKLDSRLSKVYQRIDDKPGLYDDWAATYDNDLIEDLGYVADAETCRVLLSIITDRNTRILDAGCGTGLAGRRLMEAGCTNIHGNDYSSKMLDKARATGAYLTLEQHDLTQPVVTTEPFDAAISVGVFAFSVPSVVHLVNITSALKPGGLALITVNGKAWKDVDWESKLEGFNRTYADTKLIDIQTIKYLTTEGIDGRLLTLERTS
jgi:predicted TPR repeat methyltransferase